jgi:hypothetical protein
MGHEVCGWGVGGDEGRSAGNDCVGRVEMSTACVVHGVREVVGMVGVMVGRVCGAPAGVGRVCLFFMGRVCVLVVW